MIPPIAIFPFRIRRPKRIQKECTAGRRTVAPFRTRKKRIIAPFRTEKEYTCILLPLFEDDLVNNRSNAPKVGYTL
jgi:hypothetical protein